MSKYSVTALPSAEHRPGTAILPDLRHMVAVWIASGLTKSLYSRFSNVRKIKAVRGKDLIKLNGRFLRNQIYVAKEDFDFVYDYIVGHCPNAKIV